MRQGYVASKWETSEGMETLITEIPYANLSDQTASIKNELMEAFSKVLNHGQFIAGPEVEAFETQFADLCRTRYAIGVNSGTDALILSLRALGIGSGDEVITVPNSFIASTSSILMVGAVPVFVDVREDMNMDPGQIPQAITTRTKAILPVHLTGRPADMDAILEIADRHELYVIEDCAQAVSAEYRQQRVGSFGTVGCFSLHPLKTLNACGDAGIITTYDADLYEQLQVLRTIGHKNRDEVVAWSGNSRLDTVQAAILQVKMKYLKSWTEKRRAHACFYQKELSGILGLKLPTDRPIERAVYHTFVVQADRRDELKLFLEGRGIGTVIHYPIPIHLQATASGLNYKYGSFAVTEAQADRILSLPVYPELQVDDLRYIVESIQTFYKRH